MKNIRTKQEILENHRIILIFGVPCAGKSILTYNTFVKNNEIKECVDIMKYTQIDNYCLLGKYPSDNSRRGLDTLERKQVGNFATQIINLLNQDKVVILEGVRCVSRPMLSKLSLKDVLFLFIDCDLNVALTRANNSRKEKDDKQMRGIKATYTLCTNFINDFKDKVDTFVINTSSCNDFEEKTLFDFEWLEIK